MVIFHCYVSSPEGTDNKRSQDIPIVWVCLKIVYPIVPNGFADHYPYEKWLFHWEYTIFSDKPISFLIINLLVLD